MLDVFHTATPTKGNVQYFYKDSSWTKPRGVSHVYMMLIGRGGSGDYSSGGGPGVMTIWYGAAQHVPDSLFIEPDGSAAPCRVYYRASNGLNILLSANSGLAGTSGTAMTANAFTALGLFKSTGGSTPSAMGQGGSTIGGGPYGYVTGNNGTGYFQTQPILVGVGGGNASKGGIGSGGGLNAGTGGPGLVIIAAW